MKVVYTILWLVVVLVGFDGLAPAYVVPDTSPTLLNPSVCTLTLLRRSPQPRVFLLDRFALLYIAVAIPLMVYCSLLHQVVFGAKYEFLPLMFVSTYSAIGVVGSWVGFLVVFFTS